ncbi:MAG: RCC1 domain-containing protein [Gemmatimonadota bacterium]
MKKLTLTIFLAISACDSTTGPPQLSLEIVSGADQTGGAGEALAAPIVVRVLDGDERPLTGIEVRWRAIEGGGSVDETVTPTDPTGTATVRWTLGNDIGQQLLLATTANASVTIRAAGVFQIRSLSIGFRHACALSSSGEAYCWGANDRFQLGNNSNVSSDTPVRVPSHVRFRSITAGWLHSCALSVAGEAFCWGENSVGQLGANLNAPFWGSPVAVTGGDAFIDLSAGSIHTCGITAAGLARCWGSGGQGQLGDGTAQLRQISAGEFHTCAVRTDNTAVCWGWNSSGELGTNAPSGAIVATATPVFGNTRFTSIAAGVRHTCAIGTDGRAYCWGRNALGETGQDPFVSVGTPAVVNGGENFTVIGTGNIHTCGLSAQRVYCWGRSGPSKVPIALNSTLQFSTVAVGYDRSCAVSNGKVYCWPAESLTPAPLAFPQ